MTITVRAMTIDDYPAVAELWRRTEGIGLNESDTKDATTVTPAHVIKGSPGVCWSGVSNESGAAFWNRNRWSRRPDLLVFQKAFDVCGAVVGTRWRTND